MMRGTAHCNIGRAQGGFALIELLVVIAIIGLLMALLLPAASLIPLGSLWLWEHGAIPYWAAATCVVVNAATCVVVSASICSVESVRSASVESALTSSVSSAAT